MLTIANVGLWLSLCSNCCQGEMVSGMSMTKFSEGIKVSSLGQLYPTVAKWTSAVSLEPPRIHHSIKEAVRTLQYLILQFNYSDHSSLVIKDNWNRRMSWIENTKQSYKAQISLQPKLAVSTVTRCTFIPSKCIGGNPSMCSMESLQGNSNFRCSLIGLDPAGRGNCEIKIVTTNSTQVWKTGEVNMLLALSANRRSSCANQD